MSDAEDEHDQTVVFDRADEPVVTHTVFPELSELGAMQCFSDAAWIVQLSHSLMKELQDALAVLRSSLLSYPIR